MTDRAVSVTNRGPADATRSRDFQQYIASI